ncbi:hypothetical protein OSB04_000763 [Centaurea solstitialis]|uniref:Annexin ANNAT3 n=1 Tax=Centaurea solstitialis TaxID=347529 RepID=A0AA38WKU7_9ASTR|nr:hypothetical protein OSB04_000763 [Centaurea solstitialis]
MATIKVPSTIPPPSEDSEQLQKAFAGWGTNEALIIQILAHRDGAQRKKIRETYYEAYDLDSELSSDFQRAVMLWTLEPTERDAYLANESTRKMTASNWVLIEIACTRSSEHLFSVKKAYHAKYKKSIEEDVAHHTSGDFRKLLVPLISAYRYEGDEDLKEDPENEYLKLLRAVIKCLTIPEKYYAKVLRLAINKLGTDEWALTRVITTRAERIAEEYQRRNSVPLDKAIAGDTSGDYEHMLLALMGHDDA